uniref:Flocculation protein FLO11 n=1 Tax=Phallusia mammillata TaxID=59560 RepID=A0A6F9DCX8_9ASCI|nr:flocculation protein FLO11 [Phallusia mammillata]
MASEVMEAEESIVACVKSEKTEVVPKTADVKTIQLNGNNNFNTWSSSPAQQNIKTSIGDEKTNKSHLFNFISNDVASDGRNRSNISQTGAWSIRSPKPIKAPFSCPTHTILHRRPSQENGTKSRKLSADRDDSKINIAESRRSLVFPSKSPSSAFSNIANQRPLLSDEDDLNSNILKRCNSAPVLNDVEIEDMSTSWPSYQLQPSKAGRMRRFSATVVSANASPVSGRSNSRLRLHQLKKEESLEGIQNKEAEHEREVQATIQISSNCSDLSLGGERRSSLDSCLNQSFSPKNRMSPSTLQVKGHFPTPALAGGKSCHSRAIDFNLPFNPLGSLSPTSSHHQHPSNGIPSPLTFTPSLSLFSSSPLPPSPTRSLCGPGKQCFSPSMQVPVSLARATSRSPSPSPTRRGFVTRRRSQSPCIMRPSALGAIKRKYDSDTEGSSPKRIFAPATGLALPGLAHEPPPTTVSASSPAFPHRMLVHRSHSLSSSSMDSSDASITPSPPFHVLHSFAPHHTSLAAQRHHQLYVPHSPSTLTSTAQQFDQPSRPLSPASSTCSSSSLEGIRDLQPLISPAHAFQNKKPPKERDNTVGVGDQGPH